MTTDNKPKALLDAVSGTLQDAAKERRNTLGTTGLAPGLETTTPAKMAKASQRTFPFHKPYATIKQKLEEMAFNERDQFGKRRTLTDLADEGLDLVILCHKLNSIAELRGTTPFRMIEDFVEGAVAPRKKNKPAGSEG